MKDATPTASYEAVCTHMSVDAMSIRTSLIENCCKWRSCASEQRTTTEEITTTARLVPRHQPAPLGPSMSRGSQCRTSRLDCLTPGSPVLIQHSTVQYLTVLPLCTARVLFMFLFSVSDLVPGSWLLLLLHHEVPPHDALPMVVAAKQRQHNHSHRLFLSCSMGLPLASFHRRAAPLHSTPTLGSLPLHPFPLRIKLPSACCAHDSANGITVSSRPLRFSSLAINAAHALFLHILVSFPASL